ncbi:hypothetical protein EYR36_005937 [Pleurotus pulmonarius]|nr:hypothetical protein EYR36_005937 [Pleurotus pulmonarius]
MEHSTESLSWLSEEYFDLNGSHYETLRAPPTALEFSRLVHISRPVVIEGFELPALHQWSDDYLIRKMGNRTFSVAVTPNGRADAVTKGPDGRLYFVEPYACDMTMEACKRKGEGNIHYLQSQNGNLFTNKYFGGSSEDPSEFEPLRADVLAEVPWCTEALGRPPDAVNLWIGDSKSVTSIHNDPYENVYTVIRGAKHFTLLRPTDSCYLQERAYPHATYTRPNLSSQELILTPSLSVPAVRWSSIQDPGAPGALNERTHPIHIALTAGQTLYLPPGWWHHVRQSEELTIAINWWYDVESQGMSWLGQGKLLGSKRPRGLRAISARSDFGENFEDSVEVQPRSPYIPHMPSEKSEKKEKRKAAEEKADDVEMMDPDAKVCVKFLSSSPKKSKKEKDTITVPLEDLSPLAQPLAEKKLGKKLHKTIKKASKNRQVKRGVKEVVKGIRKGEKGLLILAADINPIDIISHLPVLSEEAQIPYIFVTSKEELGHASSTKRPTSCVMVCPNQKRKVKQKDGEKEDKDDDYKELYDECYKAVEKLNAQIAF